MVAARGSEAREGEAMSWSEIQRRIGEGGGENLVLELGGILDHFLVDGEPPEGEMYGPSVIKAEILLSVELTHQEWSAASLDGGWEKWGLHQFQEEVESDLISALTKLAEAQRRGFA